MKLTDFKVLTFDCYGTLIDWESGMVEALKPLVAKVGRTLSRDEILEAHARHESAQQLDDARRSATASFSPSSTSGSPRIGASPVGWDECVDYGRSVARLAGLRRLRPRRSAISSSTTSSSSSRTSTTSPSPSPTASSGSTFDAIFTAEDIGSYKPSPRNFEYMLEKLAAPRHREGRHPAHGGEPVPRPRARQRRSASRSCWIHRRHGRAASARR